MATTYTFGLSTDDYVEIPDPANPGQVKRPPSGQVVQVRNASNQAALPNVLTSAYGYIAFTTTDIPRVHVSTDGFLTYKTLVASEGLGEAIAAGANAASAIAQASSATTTANAASTKAQQALDQANLALSQAQAGGAGGFTWDNAPAGAMGILRKSGSTWPARPNNRTDISFMWVGAQPFPALVTTGTAGYYSVDILAEQA